VSSSAGPGTKWPKVVPDLTPEQQAALDAWYVVWLERYNKNAILDRFNYGFPAGLPVPKDCRTLQIGPGTGVHLVYEDLRSQDYHVLELREEFCTRLAERLPADRVHCGNIEQRQPFADGSFDRIVAIHVLEHLRNLPAALDEISRLLDANGVFDVVLPCEGGFTYTFLRSLTTKRLFEKQFKMPYEPIIRSEHVSQLWEVNDELFKRFTREKTRHFPLPVPIDTINVFVGYRLKKRP
jgi:SAM-dependent methyltransferase